MYLCYFPMWLTFIALHRLIIFKCIRHLIWNFDHNYLLHIMFMHSLCTIRLGNLSLVLRSMNTTLGMCPIRHATRDIVSISDTSGINMIQTRQELSQMHHVMYPIEKEKKCAIIVFILKDCDLKRVKLSKKMKISITKLIIFIYI